MYKFCLQINDSGNEVINYGQTQHMYNALCPNFVHYLQYSKLFSNLEILPLPSQYILSLLLW